MNEEGYLMNNNHKLFVYRKPNAMVDHEYTDDVAITYASSRAQAYMKIKPYYDCNITDIEEVYFNNGGIAILTNY
jgi:hypothetical protein